MKLRIKAFQVCFGAVLKFSGNISVFFFNPAKESGTSHKSSCNSIWQHNFPSRLYEEPFLSICASSMEIKVIFVGAKPLWMFGAWF